MVDLSNPQPQIPAQTLSLHALSVGEGILALCQAPGLGGNYKEDLRLIREWRPSIVITLTTSPFVVRLSPQQPSATSSNSFILSC